MKKLTLVLLLTLSFTAMADACCYRGYNHGGYYHGGGWVAPALIGGVIGYELSRPPLVVGQPVIVQQPQVVVQPQVQLTPPPIGYHYQQMINPQTNQYQLVLVPN
jgi:hypothetical protein